MEADLPNDDEGDLLHPLGADHVMSSQEVVDKVRQMLVEGRPELPPLDDAADDEPSSSGPGGESERPAPPEPRQWDLGAVCECLIDHCLRLGSRDNMSVIVVLLNPAMAPKPEQGVPGGGSGTVGTASTASAASSSGAAASSAP